MLLGLAVMSVPFGCGDSGSNSGGGGNTTSHSSGYNPMSTYGTGPSTSTGGCDTGLAGTVKDQRCAICTDCADSASCYVVSNTYYSDPNQTTWRACVYGDGPAKPGCPTDDPGTAENEFTACTDACAASSPGVAEEYMAYLQCSVCGHCDTNCNSDNAFGNCSMLPAQSF
jgi:hypothetical protein